MSKETKEEIQLPSEIIEAKISNPRDLTIIGQPKIGKSTILGDFTKKYNALLLDLEKGGTEYISARKLSIYPSHETSTWEAFQNYTKIRKSLLDNKGKYEYLTVDNLTELDALSEIGGTLSYMDTIIGKGFNRIGGIKGGEKLKYGDVEWKSVLSLPEGGGYQHTRAWFLQQIEFFKQISPYRIYIAHVSDKYIKDNGKEEVVGSEIFLTGKLKLIFASKSTSLAKLVSEGDQRYLNFDVLNDSIIAGSRSPKLKGKILISKMKNDKLETYWNNIYE